MRIPKGILTVSQVIQKSSNVGSAKIALSMPRAEAVGVLVRCRASAPQTKIGFPGEASGRLRDYQRWRPIEQATMSYGHGISVSLLQLARAYSVFATDGELQPLTCSSASSRSRASASSRARTALAVRTMLEMVTQPGGTATRAQVIGYRVAGKTGTAHKLDGRGLRGGSLRVFVRWFGARVRPAPAGCGDDRRARRRGILRRGGCRTGVQRSDGRRRCACCAVPPDAPLDNVLPLESAPEVREEV